MTSSVTMVSPSFAMPSNNNRNGHVMTLRESSINNSSSSGDKDRDKHPRQHSPSAAPKKVSFETMNMNQQQQQKNNNAHHHSHHGHYHTDAHDMHHLVDPTATTTTIHSTIPMIDNRRLPYIPIRLVCGVCVYCSPDVLSSCPIILQSLQADVTRAFKVLPRSVHALVLRTNIWVNASYQYGPASDPQVLRHLTTHHQEGWLVECARDVPEKAGSIEVYSCWDFEAMRLHWNGSGLLLHELCHLIHQHCLKNGLDNEQVQQMYDTAKASSKYENVLRRDWAGLDEDYDMAYAMVDKKEFFAEFSVAFLSQGYKNLAKADFHIMEACSPPLLHPVVMERVMKQYDKVHDQTSDDKKIDNDDCNDLQSCWWWSSLIPGIVRRPPPKVRMADSVFSEAALSRCCVNVEHCNKFYPFTRGQLQFYDVELFRGMRDVWREISRWDDPIPKQQQRNLRPCCG